ncbi:MAG: hypothetical protein A2644_04240 [Candidatus Zambryskibacteria bacterium RIFCSPHIGHO2_01_FULL_39_63]|nr:MAG: hypothetical protein UT00_C0007G0012 [Parcubacteria group bacterium GW2011_GWA1_38_7]OHA87525.1 MAG: hypothetical protein A2644_04240 [Candidatus Zambryskibacteria bacterium RIFCSPHIGHO2_01_FULL_39_63]OHA95053.1 MAG: hypothetical protein A3B88_03150 [Candidatus Zambryskibacteria bacterium RIFCSPHIGHO2_02_FULL_39_19]OHA98173.1 MAG: hypothetical protein A3F20_03960 [Candidatus Zambryskibacteria bacterium RIFCSPHIGHO2_12_FULL_39_21]
MMNTTNILTTNGVEDFLKRAAEAIQILNNKNASLSERAEATRTIFGDSQKFWVEIATAMSVPDGRQKTDVVVAVPAVSAPPAQQQVSKPVAPPPSAVLPPKKPVADTVPARTLGVVRKTETIEGGNLFAEKLAKAAIQLELEDHTPMGVFRTLMGMSPKDGGHGRDYWDKCRDGVYDVLYPGLLVEKVDWERLTEKMKKNLFLDRQNASMFIKNCPKELVQDLLFGEGGVSAVVKQIQAERVENKTSPYRISFIIDCCLAVGKEVTKDLLYDAKSAVNHMGPNQMGFIGSDHWLMRKVAAMKSQKPIPRGKYVPKEEVEALHEESEESSVPTEKLLDDIQRVAEEVVAAGSESEVTTESEVAESVAS